MSTEGYMAFIGSYSNFGAQVFVTGEIRAGRLPDRDYTIQEAEQLYDASFQRMKPTLLEVVAQGEQVAITRAVENGPFDLD